MIDQPVQRVECRQIDGRVAQGFDRPVDKIGRIAHRLCGGQHDLGYQCRSRVREIFDVKVSADSNLVTKNVGLLILPRDVPADGLMSSCCKLSPICVATCATVEA